MPTLSEQLVRMEKSIVELRSLIDDETLNGSLRRFCIYSNGGAGVVYADCLWEERANTRKKLKLAMGHLVDFDISNVSDCSDEFELLYKGLPIGKIRINSLTYSFGMIKRKVMDTKQKVKDLKSERLRGIYDDTHKKSQAKLTRTNNQLKEQEKAQNGLDVIRNFFQKIEVLTETER